MQTLYAVDLDVTCVESEPTARDRLVNHLVEWIAYSTSNGPSELDLDEPGMRTLSVNEGTPGTDADRTAKWEVSGAGDNRALRLEVRQQLPGANAYFVTRVTVSSDSSVANTARIRVVMGREVTHGWLAPVPVEYLRRPGIIHRVAHDESLRVSTLGQQVDGRFLRLRHEAEVVALVDAVTSFERLPILVIRPASEQGWTFAWNASKELAGLARVVCLDSVMAFHTFNANLPQVAVPSGGARLIWPDVARLEHPTFARQECEAEQPSLPLSVLRILASLSVVARGTDAGWDSARKVQLRAEADEIERLLESARQAGDEREQLALLVKERDRLIAQETEWLDEIERIEGDLRAVQATADEAQSARFERDQWKRSYLDLLATRTDDSPGSIEDAPDLTPADANPLFEHLETTSKGLIRFTDNAARSWRKCSYEFPDRMRDALVQLTTAAVRFAQDQGEIDAQLDDWFMQRFGLEVALTDLDLKRSGAADFDFDGERLSGLPHVKLGDKTIASRCGRVHFAYRDSAPYFIVNHVGTHL